MTVLIPVVILSLASMMMAELTGKNSTVSYLILLMSSLNVLLLAGMVNFLKPAAILLYAGLIGAELLFFLKKGKQQTMAVFKKHWDPYMGLNWASSALFAVIFSIQKPKFYYWDEFAFWGPSAKLVQMADHFYTIGLNPSKTHGSYPPGNAVINYFFSFFSGEFQDHILLLSYALFYFAVFSLVARVIYDRTKNHIAAISSYFVLFLSPFMAQTHVPMADYSSLSYAYGTAMADFNLVVGFAAVIALYLADRKHSWYLLALGYLVTFKRVGIFFALLAVCVIACWELFTRSTEKRHWKKACVRLLISALLPVLVFSAWGKHVYHYYESWQPKEMSFDDPHREEKLAALAEQQTENMSDDEVQAAEESDQAETAPDAAAETAEVPDGSWLYDDTGWWYRYADGSFATGWMERNGFRYHFDQKGYLQTGWHWIEGRPYYFYEDGVLSTGQNWLERNPKLSWISILVPAWGDTQFRSVLDEMYQNIQTNKGTFFGKDQYLILGLVLLGLVAFFGCEKKDRWNVLFIGLGLTAGCFIFCRVVTYEIYLFTNGMVEYSRYMMSYYFIWMFMAFLLVMMSPHLNQLIKQLILCGVLVVTLGNIAKMGLDYTVIAAPQNAYAKSMRIEQDLEPVKKVLKDGDSVYLVYKDQDGETFFRYQHYFLPNNAGIDTKNTWFDFSINFREEIDYTSDRQYYLVATPEKFTEAMQYYFDYIYVIEADPEFEDSYGQLFSDGLTNRNLYKVTDGAIPMQEVAGCAAK